MGHLGREGFFLLNRSCRIFFARFAPSRFHGF
jgi:hypothetical protein